MKIELHIYHHLVRDDDDCDVLEELTDKLRKSSNRLAAVVKANTAKSPQPVKGETDGKPTT